MKKMAFALTFLIAGAASASVTKAKTCNASTGTLELSLEVKGNQIVQTEYSNGQADGVAARAVVGSVELSADQLKQFSAYFKVASGLTEATIYSMGGDGVLLAKSADGKDLVALVTPVSLELLGTSDSCK